MIQESEVATPFSIVSLHNIDILAVLKERCSQVYFVGRKCDMLLTGREDIRFFGKFYSKKDFGRSSLRRGRRPWSFGQ